MYKFLVSVLLGALLLISNLMQAQRLKEFPADSIGYFETMRTFLEEARKEGKPFMKEFEKVWYGGYFTENQRIGVYNVSNIMLKKKLRAFPDFRNYLFTVGSFVTDPHQTEESYQQWQEILLKLLDQRKKRDFTEFLDFCNSLFVDNAIYKSASTIWGASNKDYKFGYDSLPKITFDELDLICFAKRDSMKIWNTKGVYYPTIGVWKGVGGKVNWQKAGLLADEVYAELSSYELETRTYSYSADSVIFYNSFYLDRPLRGTLTDKILANVKTEKSTYPRFDSYNKRIRIENISPNVNFDGGFSMVGSKLLGRGDEKQDAIIEFISGDTLFLKAASESFSIRTDRIISTKASIRIYFDKDSITHPGLDFKYLVPDKLVTLYKANEGVAITPYTNSYHNIDMDFEVLNWKTDEPIITLTNLLGGTKTDARFTSKDYFKEELYFQIGGMADVNPLYTIRKMVDKYEHRKLTVQHMTHFMNISPSAAQNLIIRYSTMGFLDFDFDEGTFTVKQKLFDYVDAAAKKIDYDVINVYSNIEGSANAKINLLNYDLSINGIRGIVLSDSQKVVILPSAGQIKMKKDRNFEFGGTVKAGRFDFYGKEFKFDYSNFKIDLINVDSLSIKAESGEEDREGNPVLKPVKTVIQDVKGDLLIDHFSNKSGLKDFPQYPIFNSVDKSYVYYNSKEVLNGVYKKDNFYFQVDPFTIDSLDNFSNEQLAFDGTFTSANIFPEFRETLRLQEDFSLGFNRKTPPNGYPMYGGKGVFNDEIRLSHKGLRGDGNLKYITSTTYSKDFIFYPDSMQTIADQYFVDKQGGDIQYPPVKADGTKMKWLPKEDEMFATTQSFGMIMYDNKANFEGTTTYTPSKMVGDGTYHFERADLMSNQFVFKEIVFDADTADFQLKDEQTSGFALKTKDVNAHVDYKGRFAKFKANGKAEPIEFPINQYLCFMEEFKWYMDNGAIDLSSSSSKNIAADVKLEGSKFISTHPDQDSLFFYSPLARYDSRRHVITAKDVLFVNSADAKVYPDSGLVTIKKKANMDPLINSKIVANSVTEFHTVYNANTNILGRKNYTSSGSIDYVDQDNNKQTIYLHSINVDTTGQTIGVGDISDTVTFTLSPHFAFKGGVKLYGSKENLVFDGVTQINHNCESIPRPWIKFEAEIDPDQIFIPIDTSLKDRNDAFLSSSISMNIDSIFFYSAFLSPRTNYSDVKLLPAYGFVNYDKNAKEYRISSKEKIAEKTLPGNYLSLDVNSCKVYGEGLIDMGARTGNVKFDAAGSIAHTLKDNVAVLDIMMAIDFFFEKSLIKRMADDFNENINLQGFDFSKASYEMGLREIVGQEEADELISQLSLNGKIKRLPDVLDKRMVLSEVKMKWNEELEAFKSFGKIGITNFNKEQVNKYVDGGIMISKKRSGDVVDILLKMDANNWYYFNYRRGLMKVISSNEEFNTKIKEMKRGDRKYQNAKGEEPFTYMFGVEKEKRDFDREMQSDL